MENLENQLSNIYGQLNQFSNKELKLLLNGLHNNLDKSRLFECHGCDLCKFKYLIVETYIFNDSKKLMNRRNNELNILAQDYLITVYNFPN